MTLLLTAAQHRDRAKHLRENAGLLGYPSKERAEHLATTHEIIAKLVEAREAREARNLRHALSPSIVPG